MASSAAAVQPLLLRAFCIRASSSRASASSSPTGAQVTRPVERIVAFNGSIDLPLRPPFGCGEGDLSLPKPVEGAILG